MPAQLQSHTTDALKLTLAERPESLHSGLVSSSSKGGLIGCAPAACPVPMEMASWREGVYRPVLDLLPELNDRGRGVFTGHIECGVRLLELHAVPCSKGPGRKEM